MTTTTTQGQVPVRVLLTTGETRTEQVTLETGQSETEAIMRYGYALRQHDPRVAMVEWVGHEFAWVGHSTPEHDRAIAEYEGRQLAEEGWAKTAQGWQRPS